MKKILFIIVVFVVGFFTYNFLTYPNFDEIEDNLNSRTKRKVNQVNWKDTYDKDVQFDLKNELNFSINNTVEAKLYSNPLLPPKIFETTQAKQLVKILNDSASYDWGETTVEYKRNLIFIDGSDKIIGLSKLDVENQFVSTIPFKRTMKWGKLSKKGNLEFYKILNSN
ncbi:hypothetical protein [Epilithonimonas sp.]|uniref:hypothetical protein n=1 Tax=Epilithonimonas sp. TaxID=2894511 RepID=UPI002898C13E|nr:hypothetical protein [Epilithonimonas sp.]